jgi:hypothetical protein
VARHPSRGFTAFVAAEQAKWFLILEKVMRETP